MNGPGHCQTPQNLAKGVCQQTLACNPLHTSSYFENVNLGSCGMEPGCSCKRGYIGDTCDQVAPPPAPSPAPSPAPTQPYILPCDMKAAVESKKPIVVITGDGIEGGKLWYMSQGSTQDEKPYWMLCASNDAVTCAIKNFEKAAVTAIYTSPLSVSYGRPILAYPSKFSSDTLVLGCEKAYDWQDEASCGYVANSSISHSGYSGKYYTSFVVTGKGTYSHPWNFCHMYQNMAYGRGEKIQYIVQGSSSSKAGFYSKRDFTGHQQSSVIIMVAIV